MTFRSILNEIAHYAIFIQAILRKKWFCADNCENTNLTFLTAFDRRSKPYRSRKQPGFKQVCKIKAFYVYKESYK